MIFKKTEGEATGEPAAEATAAEPGATGEAAAEAIA